MEDQFKKQCIQLGKRLRIIEKNLTDQMDKGNQLYHSSFEIKTDPLNFETSLLDSSNISTL